jgi:hypothetical protein
MVHSYVLLFGYLEHLDFLRLRHAKRLMCWDGLCIKPLNLHATLHVAMQIAAILNAFRTITKNFCALHIQSNTNIFHLAVQYLYNYMFRPYMLAIFRLWFNLQISYTRCAGCSFRVLGVGWGERDLVVSIVGTVTWGCYKWIIISTVGWTVSSKCLVFWEPAELLWGEECGWWWWWWRWRW